MHDDPAPAAEGSTKLPMGRLAAQLVGVLGVLVVVAGGLGWALRPTVERFSHTFIDNLGLPGLFFGCMVTDVIMLPKEPFLLAAYAAGVDFWIILALGSSGAMSAAILGWAMGRTLGQRPWVQSRFEQHNIHALMDRYGVAFLVIAGLVPFPYSVAVWAAGATGMPFGRFLLVILIRIPKVLISLGVIAGGWGFGAWMHGV